VEIKAILQLWVQAALALYSGWAVKGFSTADSVDGRFV
jgi:hypothetical protein